MIAVDKPPASRCTAGAACLRSDRANRAPDRRPSSELVHLWTGHLRSAAAGQSSRPGQTSAALREGRVDKRTRSWSGLARREREVSCADQVSLPHRGTRVRVEQVGGQAENGVLGRRVWTDIDPPMSLLEAELHTGRTHQIRVTDAISGSRSQATKSTAISLGTRSSPSRTERMFLHARRLCLRASGGRREVAIEAALPLGAQPVSRGYGFRGANDVEPPRRFRLLAFDWMDAGDSTALMPGPTAGMRRRRSPAPMRWTRATSWFGTPRCIRHVAPTLQPTACPIFRALPGSYLAATRRSRLFGRRSGNARRASRPGFMLRLPPAKTRAGLARALARHGIADHFASRSLTRIPQAATPNALALMDRSASARPRLDDRRYHA